MFYFVPSDNARASAFYNPRFLPLAARDRYLTAVEELRLAEAQYTFTLREEAALQAQREVEIRWRHIEEARRRHAQRRAVEQDLTFAALMRSSGYAHHPSLYSPDCVCNTGPKSCTYGRLEDRVSHTAAQHPPVRRSLDCATHGPRDDRYHNLRQVLDILLRDEVKSASASANSTHPHETRAIPQRKPVITSSSNTQQQESRDFEYALSLLLDDQLKKEDGGHVASTVQAPTIPSTSSNSGTVSALRDGLATRLQGERDGDIRDVLQTLLSSFLTALQPVQSTSEPDSTTTPPSAGSPRPSGQESASAKGKEKHVSFDLSSASGKQATTDVSSALDAIAHIEATFEAIENDFVFPPHLDFSSSPSSPTSQPYPPSSPSNGHLAYTSNNAPVRYYQHALNTLLAELDAIESAGSDAVRARRKRVVDRIGGVLEDIDGRVERRLEKWVKVENRDRDADEVTAVAVDDATASKPEMVSESLSTAVQQDAVVHGTATDLSPVISADTPRDDTAYAAETETGPDGRVDRSVHDATTDIPSTSENPTPSDPEPHPASVPTSSELDDIISLGDLDPADSDAPAPAPSLSSLNDTEEPSQPILQSQTDHSIEPAEEVEEVLDTFVLPAPAPSPSPILPAAKEDVALSDEDDVIIVPGEGQHVEDGGSDGAWSEVEG